MHSGFATEVLAAFAAPLDFGTAAPFHRASFPGEGGGEDVALSFDAADDGGDALVRLEHTEWSAGESGQRTRVVLVATLRCEDGAIRDAHEGAAPISAEAALRQLRLLMARLGVTSPRAQGNS